MKHELKTWPEYFEKIWSGHKTFEIRKNDRHFREGEYVLLREWSVVGGYSGREILTTITYVFRGGSLGGLQDGFVVFSFEENSRIETTLTRQQIGERERSLEQRDELDPSGGQ